MHYESGSCRLGSDACGLGAGGARGCPSGLFLLHQRDALGAYEAGNACGINRLTAQDSNEDIKVKGRGQVVGSILALAVLRRQRLGVVIMWQLNFCEVRFIPTCMRQNAQGEVTAP
jgi:hypothetical protein